MDTKHEYLDHPDVLNQWAGQVDAQLERVTTDIKSLAEDKGFNILSNKAELVEAADKQAGDKFGNMLSLIAKGDDEKLNRIGIYTGNIEYDGKPAQGQLERTVDGSPLVTDTTTGSYIVPEEYLTRIIRKATDISELMPLVMTVPMQSRIAYAPSAAGELTMSYVSGDAGDLVESACTFDQRTLTAETYACYMSISDALMEDSLLNFGSYYQRLASTAVISKWESEVLVGTSPFTGIQTAASVLEHVMGSNSFADIDVDDLWEAIELLTSQVKRRGLVWIMSAPVWDSICRLRDAQGRFLVMDPAGQQRPRALLSFPVVISDEMPTTSASDTPFIYLLDPKLIYYGRRVGLEVRYYSGTLQSVKNTQNYFRIRSRWAFDLPLPAHFVRISTSV